MVLLNNNIAELISDEICSMFSHEAQDVQIKQEPILFETNEPPPYDNSFIKQENSSYLNNSILYAMGYDLLPKTKRLRSDDTEDVNTLKRMKTKEAAPNFRRPWPKTVKSSALYSTTNEVDAPQSFTNFSISNLIKDNDLSSKEIINNKQFQKTSYNADMPEISYHAENFHNKDNVGYSNLDTNLIKNEPNVHASYFENRSNHETKTIMAAMISEVQKDLDTTNESDDNENECINQQSGISDKDTNHRFNNDTNKEVRAQNNSNDSNLFRSVQNANTEYLRLIISKENNTPNSNIKNNYKSLYREEQPLELTNNENPTVSKNPIKMSNSNTDHLKTDLSKEKNITPVSKRNYHAENFNLKDNVGYRELDTNIIKKEHNVHASFFENRSNHETRTNMATKISEVQNDLNITNESDDNENECINQQSGTSDKDTNHRFNNDTNKEVRAHNNSNDSNLVCTVQNANTKHLRLVISKENNTPKSKIKDNYKYLDREEQPLELTNNENPTVSKNPIKMSNSNTNHLKTDLSKEKIITPVSKIQSKMKENNSTLDMDEQPLDLLNKEKTSVNKHCSQLDDSNSEHLKLGSSKEKKKHSSKKKSKRKEKKYLDINEQPFAIHNKENTIVSKHYSEISNLNTEHLKLVISKEHNKKPNSEKKSKRKEGDNYYPNKDQPLTLKSKENKIVSQHDNKMDSHYPKNERPLKMINKENEIVAKHDNQMDSYYPKNEQPLTLTNKENKIVNKHDNDISNSQNKQDIKIKLEPSFKNTPGSAGRNLQVSTPLRDLKKNKSSKSLKRYSLPNISDIKPNINDSLINQVNDKKVTPPPRVFMKKIKWKDILQKEKMFTDTRVKIHKMVFCQEDGATSEIAVKAHLENLDWSSLELVPKTMIVEEGAVMANLQGIKGVPYLCGVIIEDPPALVMSYYKGRTLGDYLEEGDTLFALRTFSRACEIVGKIHHRGWAHYDLHADNILGRVNNNGSMSVTLLNYAFCRKTSVNPHYGIYLDPEDLEGHHLPADIIDQRCNGTYVDRYSLCYILEEINSQLKDISETVDIRDASSLGLMTEQPHLRPSSSHLAQLVSKLISKHNHDSWKFGIDD